MSSTRSRRGCSECRSRRRKCDESKPACGLCLAFNRPCSYTLQVVWSTGPKLKKKALSNRAAFQLEPGTLHSNSGEGYLEAEEPFIPAQAALPLCLPRALPNGVPLSSRYHRLLSYFTNDILASLSCHPSVHDDLCRGLVPATLESPQLLSACLSLSAAGYLSRGMSEVDGVETSRILQHLQSSGLALLRQALEAKQTDETVLATCLIWCLADVFTYRQGSSSWRTHLQGIRAILDSHATHRYFALGTAEAHAGMRHLYLLYLSLQTLPFVPEAIIQKPPDGFEDSRVRTSQPSFESKIDGFLGYSEELLDILQKINELAVPGDEDTERNRWEADALLAKLNAMIRRDAEAPPDVAIHLTLSPEHNRDYELCHRTFQQATLIHVYRRLYHLPSNSAVIQAAVDSIASMVSQMTQGQPCRTWVAMAMPLFAIGCESFSITQQSFVRDRVHQLESCIPSYHVKAIRQGLEDVWRLRREAGDCHGDLCANQLLETLQYNIILF